MRKQSSWRKQRVWWECVVGGDAELQCLIRDSCEKATGRRPAGSSFHRGRAHRVENRIWPTGTSVPGVEPVRELALQLISRTPPWGVCILFKIQQEALKATGREMTHLDLYLRNNSNSSNTSHLYSLRKLTKCFYQNTNNLDILASLTVVTIS